MPPYSSVRRRLPTSDLAIIIPVWGRPEHIEPLLTNLDTTTPGARAVFMTTPEDIAPRSEIQRLGFPFYDVPRLPEGRGDYARKINAGISLTTEPLIFMAATDLRFHHGWFRRASSLLSDTVHVVGTNDMGNARVIRGEHSTHTLVTREYIETQGLISGEKTALYEGYWHEYCDDEFIATAKHRGAFKMAFHSRVEHLHPVWGKGKWDASYLQYRVRQNDGKTIFDQRSAMWT